MKALICGAGIAGLAVAQRLHSHGWEVVIVEHTRGPRSQGYMLDFFGPGYDAARAMGALPRLERVAYRIDEVSMWIATDGAALTWITTCLRVLSTGGCSVSRVRPRNGAA